MSSLLGRHSWRALEIHKIGAKISFDTLSCWRRREVILLTIFGWKSPFASVVLRMKWKEKPIIGQNQNAVSLSLIIVGPIGYHPIYGCLIFGLFLGQEDFLSPRNFPPFSFSFSHQIFSSPNVNLFKKSVHHSHFEYFPNPPFHFLTLWSICGPNMSSALGLAKHKNDTATQNWEPIKFSNCWRLC